MRVKIINPTFINGEAVDVPAPGKDGKPPKGDGIISVSEAEGRALITAGKALPVDDAPDAGANRMLDGSGDQTR